MTMKESNSDFQKRSLVEIKKYLNSDKLLVLANTCVKSVDIEHDIFPCIPIKANDEILDLIAKRKMNRKNHKSFVHKPDIGIIKYSSIYKVWLNRKEHVFETDDKCKEFFKNLTIDKSHINDMKQPINWTIFSHSIPENIEKMWSNDKDRIKFNTTDYSIILKKNEALYGVADAKNYYKSIISLNEVNKLKLDSFMLASKECFLVCRDSTRISQKVIHELDLKYHDKLNNTKIYLVNNYHAPELLDSREQSLRSFELAIDYK